MATAPSTSSFNAPIGLQLYSLRAYFPDQLISTLDKLQEIGIQALETYSPIVPYPELKQLCDDRGMPIVSAHMDFELLKDRPEEAIEIAKTLDIKYLGCAWIAHEVGQFSYEDMVKAINVFNRVGELGAKEGVTFFYHVHGYEFKPHGEGNLLDLMIQSTDPKTVALQMDTFWVNVSGGDPVDWLKKYPSRWKLMHLKDVKKGTPKNTDGRSEVSNNVPLGSGILDMPAILATCQEIGVEHYMIEDESELAMRQLPQSINYLKQL